MKLTLFMTEICNLKCPYCDITYLKDQKVCKADDLRKWLKIIKNSRFDEIGITGGEPALHSLLLNMVLEELGDKKLTLNTNGYAHGYPEIYKKFDKILYHVTDHVLEFDHPAVIYNVVYYGRESMPELRELFQKYPEIKFHLTFMDRKSVDFDYDLDPEEFREDVEELMKYNTDVSTFEKILKIYPKNAKYRNLCAMYLWDPSINFVDMTIQKCVCSHTRSASVELTEQNFNNLCDKILEIKQNDLCNNCFHTVMSFNHMMEYVLGYAKKNK